MNNYLVRVELKGCPSLSKYFQLHAAMKSYGFERTIVSDESVEYKLPHAMYSYVGFDSLTDVCEKAKVAARTVQPDFEVFVSIGPHMWYGLEIVPPVSQITFPSRADALGFKR